MSRVWLTGLPGPPDDDQWCTMCVMLAKGIINDRHQKLYAEVNGDGKDGDHWMKVSEPFPLQVAVVRAIAAELPQAGVLDLCWTHAAGLSMQAPSALTPANGAIPPGLLRGRG